MATITNRNDFKTYCLQRLGFPVINIEVDDDQVEARVDDALQYWADYHFDGTQKVYYIKALTNSQITCNTNISTHFTSNTIITGASSGASAGIVSFAMDSNNTIVITGNQPFTIGETLQYTDSNGVVHNTNGTVTSYSLGDVDARYINLDPSVTTDTQGNPIEIIGVTRIFPISDSQATINMFDLRYQLRLNELYDFTSASYINYTLTQQHLRSLELMFTGEVPIRYDRHMRKLFIDWAWGNSEAPAGQVVVAECYAVINPNVYTAMWNDRFLKEYCTALIKKQWGNNLKKHDELQLPGGVKLNGQRIYEEAKTEIEELEKEMENSYGGVLEFYMN